MLIDTHAHLTDNKLKDELETILKEARAEGVGKVITIGTSILDSAKAIKTANQFNQIYAGVGVYPDEDKETSISDICHSLLSLITDKVVGIGETGIDIPKEGVIFSIERQLALFEMHIEISFLTKLPLIIHNRGADELVYKTLRSNINKLQGGVFHCYTGNASFAKKVLDLGFYLSFSGIITYNNALEIQEAAKSIPLDRLIIETDAPYLTPHPFRKEICTPKHVKTTCAKLAQILNLPTEKVEEITYNNAVRLFPQLKK